MMIKPTVFCLLMALATALSATAQQAPLDRQGHRGCRGLMPENTIPAMRKALDLGVTTLEMDVLVSKDNQVFLSHDPYMSPDFVLTPDGQPIAPAEAYARLKKLPPPRYNIETKTTPAGDGTLHPQPAQFVELLLTVVQAKGIQSRVTIQSFDPRTLEVVHRAQPTLSTALLVANIKGLTVNLEQLSFRPTIYSPSHQLVTAKLVEACHQLGIQVIPWTVNSAADIARLTKLRVDGIITDYPDLFALQPAR